MIRQLLRMLMWIRYESGGHTTIVDWARWNHVYGNIFVREGIWGRWKRYNRCKYMGMDIEWKYFNQPHDTSSIKIPSTHAEELLRYIRMSPYSQDRKIIDIIILLENNIKNKK